MYENDAAAAFLDVNPRSPGHTMVVPKEHCATILELPAHCSEGFIEAIKETARRLQRALEPDGFTMGINHGRVSGQVVDHLHFHIMPRFEGDGGGSIHSVVNNSPEESLGDIAEKIRRLDV